jgi:glycosyltransferase involved in cell wall biosynthesis
MEVHRVGGRYSYGARVRRYVGQTFPRDRFDLVVEDLNKVPLFTPRWSPAPCLLLVHHLFGSTAFESAGPVLAGATWLLERPLPRVYRRVPIIAVSESTKADLVGRGFHGSRIQVVHNGVDVEQLTPGAESDRYREPTLLYLGRLKRYKRVDLVIEAVARLRSSGERVRLLIAGRGDARAALVRKTRELDLDEDWVRFMGFVSEAEKLELLRRAWVHILTSSKEGWGISNLEAAACATPTVASDAPGLRDSVLDGRTGYLVPHGNVEELARIVQKLLHDDALRRRLGEEGRRFAESHSWDRSAERFRSAVERAVASS